MCVECYGGYVRRFLSGASRLTFTRFSPTDRTISHTLFNFTLIILRERERERENFIRHINKQTH